MVSQHPSSSHWKHWYTPVHKTHPHAMRSTRMITTHCNNWLSELHAYIAVFFYRDNCFGCTLCGWRTLCLSLSLLQAAWRWGCVCARACMRGCVCVRVHTCAPVHACQTMGLDLLHFFSVPALSSSLQHLWLFIFLLSLFPSTVLSNQSAVRSYRSSARQVWNLLIDRYIGHGW